MLRLPPPPPFRPHPCLPGGDLQTVLGLALPKGVAPLEENPDFVRVAIPLRCGGTLDGWYHHGEVQPAVLLLHGLGGTTRSGYLRQGAVRFAGSGHAVLALDHRGSGDEHEESTRPYMAGHIDDVEDALLWLKERAATTRIFAVGYSISGNTLLKLLGHGTEHAPELSVAICPPIDLDAASHDLRHPRSKAYDLWVLRSCRRWVPELTGDSAPGSYHVPRLSGLRRFDELYMGPVWGFENLSQYYRSASAVHSLHRVESPVVVLHSDNDPIVSSRVLETAPRSPHVQVEIIEGGGHLGFLERRPGSLGVHRWLPDAVDHYLAICREGSMVRHHPGHKAARRELARSE
ncbi:putative hydrolase [Planctomycetes bacterium Poly30]|uniref:Putative hydrolase n=1 Tax=Saltatorellus ferox TaxID=2528018 RepID=A0A518ELX4_9BACT|nr:putative hydrolase [Planctomycetes bacterium Poly30]